MISATDPEGSDLDVVAEASRRLIDRTSDASYVGVNHGTSSGSAHSHSDRTVTLNSRMDDDEFSSKIYRLDYLHFRKGGNCKHDTSLAACVFESIDARSIILKDRIVFNGLQRFSAYGLHVALC